MGKVLKLDAVVVGEGARPKKDGGTWEYVIISTGEDVFRCGLADKGTKVGIELMTPQTLLLELSAYQENAQIRFQGVQSK